jgi:hypothetical protein
MAEARQSWTKALAVAVLCGFAGISQVAPAQVALGQSGASEAAGGQGSSAPGVIAGKLTDLHSAPLDGVTVVVRNEATGAEASATTTRNGSYRFGGLDPGEYTLEAESAQLGRGRVEGIFVAAGHEARVQTAIQFELPAIESVQTAFHQSAPVKVTVSPPVAARTKQDLAVSGRILPEPAREMPAAEAPELTATMAAEPLLSHPLSGRHGPDLNRDLPETTTPLLASALPSEPLRALLLRGHAMAGTQPVPALVASILTSTLPSVPLLLLPLTGRPWQEAGPPSLLAFVQPADAVAPAVTTKVSANELQAVPVSGRRWQDFVLDAPSVATPAGGVSTASARAGGQEPIDSTVDGVSIRPAFGGSSGFGPESSGPGANRQGGAAQNGMGQAWAGGRGPAVAEAAIREVEMAAGNVEAEEARAAGGRMNVQTQRGGNGLHGQGFLFDRQNVWGAQNPFTQWVKETAPATGITTPVFTPEPYSPPDHETVWGIGVGSQLRRDKLFWFAALDSYDRNDPGVSTVKHPDLFFTQPSDDQMQVLCARLELTEPGQSGQPKACTNATVQGLAAYSPMLEKLAGLLGPAPRTARQWTGFARLDWQAAERHRFSLEGIGADWNSPGGGLTRVSESYGTNSFGTSAASEEWLLGRWEAFLTPNLLLVSQGSAGRGILSARAETPSPFEQTFLGPNGWGQLPQIVVDNRYGFTIGNPSRFGKGSYPDEHLYQARESVDWVRGSLLVKAGFDFNHNFDATSSLRNQTGTYSYSHVENFISDALVFAKFGLTDALDPADQHNCDQTGKVWRDPAGTLRGMGYLPCYSYYSQVIGPANWYLSTNDLAGFATAQWQPGRLFVLSAGLRWEREQLPPPIASLANPGYLLTQELPSLGNQWGPRVSLAVGQSETHWPLLRMGYGIYFGRTPNATIETALTQTGSPSGDMSFFMRPTDNLNAGGAPPFPYVLADQPGSVIKPDVVEFAHNFRNPEIHQAVAAVEESLPAHVQVTASAMMSLSRRLPVYLDENLGLPTPTITYTVCDQAPTGPGNTSCGHTGLGPIKATQITVPLYASWSSSGCPSGAGSVPAGQQGWCNPGYQQIAQIASKANSTYEAAMLKVARYGRRGLSLHAHYIYSHAMDWNPGESPFDPAASAPESEFRQEYGTSSLDMRHSAAATVIFETPWKLDNLNNFDRRLVTGWMVSGIGSFHSGMPYTMRVSGSLPEEFTSSGALIEGLGPGMNGSGGDSRVYGVGNDNQIYNIGRNTYRYPATWKADLRLGKSFDLGQMRKLELLVESFNLFNHQNVTELETTGYTIESGSPPVTPGTSGKPPSLNFLTGLKTNPITGLATPAFGQPLNINATDFYRERQLQFGMRMRF